MCLQHLAWFMWPCYVYSVEEWGRFSITFSGDKVPLRENAFLITNHITAVDWQLIMSFAKVGI